MRVGGRSAHLGTRDSLVSKSEASAEELEVGNESKRPGGDKGRLWDITDAGISRGEARWWVVVVVGGGKLRPLITLPGVHKNEASARRSTDLRGTGQSLLCGVSYSGGKRRNIFKKRYTGKK